MANNTIELQDLSGQPQPKTPATFLFSSANPALRHRPSRDADHSAHAIRRTVPHVDPLDSDSESGQASSIDADDFLGPPALDPLLVDEDDLHYIPTTNRPATPERVALRRQRQRAQSISKNPENVITRALKRFAPSSSGSARTSSSDNSSAKARSKRSSKSTSSHVSRFSTVSWRRLRFWRDSSSSSSSRDTDSDGSDSEDSDYVPPQPTFTLYTPNLDPMPLGVPPADVPLVTTFDSLEASTLQEALDSLVQFWKRRDVPEDEGGDIGLTSSSNGNSNNPNSNSNSNNSNANLLQPTITVQRPELHRAPPSQAQRLLPQSYGSEYRKVPYNGSAWWLDIMCPSIQDMRALRKLVPLHPLTIEDILHQDPREKCEMFEAPNLAYQFIVFRAIDERCFRYTDPAHGSPDAGEKSFLGETRIRSRGGFTIVEGVGGKEGLEGMGVGAINLYLVIYQDGILSASRFFSRKSQRELIFGDQQFHFEPLDKHVEIVKNKIQSVAVGESINSRWIAYCLMDSIVDAFFPLISYIEGETKELDTYLADPVAHLTARTANEHSSSFNETLAQHKVTASNLRKASRDHSRSLRPHPIASQWQHIKSLVPSWIPLRLTSGPVLRGKGGKVRFVSLAKPKNLGKAISASMSSSTAFQPALLLNRITTSRKLVTGLSRLLTPKTDVVRGMRKRGQELGEIVIYLGDLEDHIYTLQQNLTFYEVILNHNSPVLLGLLRLALDATKQHNDKLLIRLYLVTLVFLAVTTVTGSFGMNVDVPHDGDRETHIRKGHTKIGPPYVFFSVAIVSILVVVSCVLTYIWHAFKSVRSGRRRQLHTKLS